jgi:filamentous hemagglutinin family protein
MFVSTQTIVLSGLLLSSTVVAAPGGGLIADQTAGTRVTVQNQTHTITGGVLQGGNLLHSFREFNLESGEVADFRAAAQTHQIISRITGDNNSWINGTVRVSGGSQADLYLLNPNGVLFGQDASLDVPGSLYASTADYVLLADGQRVLAEPGQGVSLTVAAPEAFGFLHDRVGEIRVEGSRLSVTEGQTISLVGGGIHLTGSNTNAVLLQAAAGQINLTAVASAGEAARDGVVITNPSRIIISQC